jgi:hypothetical protein
MKRPFKGLFFVIIDIDRLHFVEIETGGVSTTTITIDHIRKSVDFLNQQKWQMLYRIANTTMPMTARP